MSKNYRGYVAGLPLTEALWWFIENRGELGNINTNPIFFDLRERYREHQGLNGQLVKSVESLLTDIAGMKCPDVSDMTESFEEGFGPFSEFVQDGDDAMYIEWPNLDISAKAVQQALDALKNPKPAA